MVACTSSVGCKFALSDTKRHALALAEHLDARLRLDRPINIRLTGCPNSCSQHYVGDIGLLATKVERGDDEVEGYHVLVGGGSGAETALGRAIWASVPADEMVMRVEAMLRAYLARRRFRAPGFRLPASADTPIIMIGAGTRIAPFRAFLKERRAIAARGRKRRRIMALGYWAASRPSVGEAPARPAAVE